MSECAGRRCEWTSSDGFVQCLNGSGGCTSANFYEAAPSDFHPQSLIAATKAIKAVIELVPPDPKGRKLSLIAAVDGVLLAWVHHGADQIEDGVTQDSTDEEIIDALGLILPDSSGQSA